MIASTITDIDPDVVRRLHAEREAAHAEYRDLKEQAIAARKVWQTACAALDRYLETGEPPLLQGLPDDLPMGGICSVPTPEQQEEFAREHPEYSEVLPDSGAGRCRIRQCVESDCSRCIARTGAPCSWADDNRTLCTACLPLVNAEIDSVPGIPTGTRKALTRGLYHHVGDVVNNPDSFAGLLTTSQASNLLTILRDWMAVRLAHTEAGEPLPVECTKCHRPWPPDRITESGECHECIMDRVAGKPGACSTCGRPCIPRLQNLAGQCEGCALEAAEEPVNGKGRKRRKKAKV